MFILVKLKNFVYISDYCKECIEKYTLIFLFVIYFEIISVWTVLSLCMYK